MSKSRETLKTYFETGDIPTELQFAELIDSLRHLEDGEVIKEIKIENSQIILTVTDENNATGTRQITINQPNANTDYVPKTGGQFTGTLRVSSSKDINDNVGVWLEPNGDFVTTHKIPRNAGRGGGLQISSNEEKGLVAFQFRGKPGDWSTDQTVQMGYYEDQNLFTKGVHNMQMFQPNSLFVIGGWLGAKGTKDGYKEGDKFRVINGNAEIDGNIRAKNIYLKGDKTDASLITMEDFNGSSRTGMLQIAVAAGNGYFAKKARTGDSVIRTYLKNIVISAQATLDRGGHIRFTTGKHNPDAQFNYDEYERLTITNEEGFVGVNTNDPKQRLHVNGGQLRVQTSSGFGDLGSKSNEGFHFETDRPNFYFNKGVFANGDITASGNVTAFSDQRLKSAVQPFTENILDKINKLKPVYYQWKDKAKEQSKQLGFIAQEVKELFPEWVHQGEGQEHLSMSYDKMGAVLAVKGIQELSKQVEELKQQIKDLQHGVTH